MKRFVLLSAFLLMTALSCTTREGRPGGDPSVMGGAVVDKILPADQNPLGVFVLSPDITIKNINDQLVDFKFYPEAEKRTSVSFTLVNGTGKTIAELAVETIKTSADLAATHNCAGLAAKKTCQVKIDFFTDPLLLTHGLEPLPLTFKFSELAGTAKKAGGAGKITYRTTIPFAAITDLVTLPGPTSFRVRWQSLGSRSIDVVHEVRPYPGVSRSGVRVTFGDVSGSGPNDVKRDHVPDVIVAPWSGNAEIVAYDGRTGEEIHRLIYDATVCNRGYYASPITIAGDDTVYLAITSGCDNILRVHAWGNTTPFYSAAIPLNAPTTNGITLAAGPSVSGLPYDDLVVSTGRFAINDRIKVIRLSRPGGGGMAHQEIQEHTVGTFTAACANPSSGHLSVALYDADTTDTVKGMGRVLVGAPESCYTNAAYLLADNTVRNYNCRDINPGLADGGIKVAVGKGGKFACTSTVSDKKLDVFNQNSTSVNDTLTFTSLGINEIALSR